MKRRALYIICGIPAAILLFLFLTVWFVSKDAIRGVLERSAANAGYTLTLSGFAKKFPVGIKAQTLEVASPKGSLIRVERLRVGVKLLPLLVGKVRLDYSGRIGGGDVEGELSLGKEPGWSIEGSKVRLEEIPFFTSVAGARVKGDLRVTGHVATVKGTPTGDLQLDVRGADLAGVKIGEMPLPDASYRQVRGALRIDKGIAQLKSFTLEGDGMYVRLKGSLPVVNPLGNSPLDLTLELMPKPDFLERQKFVFLLMIKYQTSPGVYSIPIHGTLAHPSI